MSAGGWDRMDADWWGVVAETISRPWPKEAAWFDLRHFSSTRAGIPSRRALAARWGWTDGRVRTQLRNVHEWWDDHKGEAPRYVAPRPANPPGPSHDQPGPSGTQRDPLRTVETEQLARWDPTGPSDDQPGPSDRHTRVDPPSRSPSRSQPPLPPQRGGGGSPVAGRDVPGTVHDPEAPDPCVVMELVALEKDWVEAQGGLWADKRHRPAVAAVTHALVSGLNPDDIRVMWQNAARSPRWTNDPTVFTLRNLLRGEGFPRRLALARETTQAAARQSAANDVIAEQLRHMEEDNLALLRWRRGRSAAAEAK